MKCKDCIYYKKTIFERYDLKPYIGKGYTLNEILELSQKDEPILVYDCPYSDDWIEADSEANKCCDNMFKKREV